MQFQEEDRVGSDRRVVEALILDMSSFQQQNNHEATKFVSLC